MKAILAIARVTIIEQLRNRLYLIIIFFGGAVLVSSILIGSLAPGHATRVIMDFGLVAMELFGLTTAVFGAVSLVIQEMESKTIYLIMTRPVDRSSYILGRFFGLVTAVLITMLGMAVIHVLVMLSNITWFKEFTFGWPFWSTYAVLFLMAVGKMVVTSAIALFFSLFATSAVSALVFTGFFWIAGHFGPELTFMIDKTVTGPMRSVVKVIAFVLPNFQYFNLKDMFATHLLPPPAFFGWCLAYSICYTGVFLSLSALLFSRKEF